MPDPKLYIPILKAKKAEFWALRLLKVESTRRIIPLVEMIPPAKDKTDADQVEAILKQLERSWPINPVYIDFQWVDEQCIESFFGDPRTKGLKAIPVTSPDRSPLYQSHVRAAIQETQRGVIFRIGASLLEDEEFADGIEQLLKFHGLAPSGVDVILDYGSISNSNSSTLSKIMRAETESFPLLKDWRTFSIAASASPSLDDIPRESWVSMPRAEWLAWLSILRTSNPLKRKPGYSDYAIGSPGLPPSVPVKPIPKLRYSCGDQYLVYKADSAKFKLEGNALMNSICASLVAKAEFTGIDFSRGDQEIQERATTLGSPGGATEWIQWCTNHYLELVVSQLANHPSP